MTTPEPFATDPADVAYRAALEALSSGVDFAEWVVALVAAVAVSEDVESGDLPLFRRPGSWEAAGVADLVQSAGAYVDPDAHRRQELPLLQDTALSDVVRFTVPTLRERFGAELADQAAGLADAIDEAHTRLTLDGREP